MKIVAFNGSPRKKGNTHGLIQLVFRELQISGIKTEEINVGLKPVRGCIACMKCAENQNKRCAIDNDLVNDCLDKMEQADGIILGSPVYVASLSGQMKSFIDRTAMTAAANDGMLARKVGASVVAVRRAGALPAFHDMNAFFTILQMIVVGSSYWNMGYGMEPGEVEKDDEGIQTMRNLGRNLAWVLNSLKKAKAPPPQTPVETLTNFIR